MKIKIFCTSIKYLKVIDKLPKYINPIGLGINKFPDHWLDEKKGTNISNLNKHYGELTGLYWIWKNILPDMKDEDIIGNCHYRKLWLNNLYFKKIKISFSSLNSNLFKPNNHNFKDIDCAQIQPIIFQKKNLIEDFMNIHKTDILIKCADFLKEENKELYLKHLRQNKLYPLNMFITKVKFFKEYCEEIFPWLEKSFNLCIKKNLCVDYNMRLPAFLAERFTSFWFSKFSRRVALSYARLGNIYLSNQLNNIINPLKLPFTFTGYPTIHKY
tara:strand:+ start:68 stop:880 length:813 start_codon:yes stop_codon:yes gene_type:complete